MPSINTDYSAPGINELQQPKNQLSPDDFIKLFLAQMRNQNPMHPTDSSAILQQMAEVSTISASHDMQNSLAAVSKNVNMALANSQVLESTQLIGKHVQVASGKSPLAEEGLSGSAIVPGAATDVKVAIKDAAGNVIKTIDLGAVASGGLVDFKWNGLGDDGKKYDPAYYTLSATAMMNGKSMDVPTAGAFKVMSVGLNQKSGSIVLNVDGLGGMDMSDIIKIL